MRLINTYSNDGSIFQDRQIEFNGWGVGALTAFRVHPNNEHVYRRCIKRNIIKYYS